MHFIPRTRRCLSSPRTAGKTSGLCWMFLCSFSRDLRAWATTGSGFSLCLPLLGQFHHFIRPSAVSSHPPELSVGFGTWRQVRRPPERGADVVTCHLTALWGRAHPDGPGTVLSPWPGRHPGSPLPSWRCPGLSECPRGAPPEAPTTECGGRALWSLASWMAGRPSSRRPPREPLGLAVCPQTPTSPGAPPERPVPFSSGAGCGAAVRGVHILSQAG